jgi:hypothetical protein
MTGQEEVPERVSTLGRARVAQTLDSLRTEPFSARVWAAVTMRSIRRAAGTFSSSATYSTAACGISSTNSGKPPSLATAAAVLATVPLGLYGSALGQLALVFLVFLVLIVSLILDFRTGSSPRTAQVRREA